MSGEKITPSDEEILSPKGLVVEKSFETLKEQFENEFVRGHFESYGGQTFRQFVELDQGYQVSNDEILPKLSIGQNKASFLAMNPEGVIQFMKMSDDMSERQLMLDAYIGLGVAEAFLGYYSKFNSRSNIGYLEDRSSVFNLFQETQISDHFAVGEHAYLLLGDKTIYNMQRLRACFGMLYQVNPLFEAVLRPKFVEQLKDSNVNKAYNKQMLREFIPGEKGYGMAAKWDVEMFSSIEFAGAFPLEGEEIDVLLGMNNL